MVTERVWVLKSYLSSYCSFPRYSFCGPWKQTQSLWLFFLSVTAQLYQVLIMWSLMTNSEIADCYSLLSVPWVKHSSIWAFIYNSWLQTQRSLTNISYCSSSCALSFVPEHNTFFIEACPNILSVVYCNKKKTEVSWKLMNTEPCTFPKNLFW